MNKRILVVDDTIFMRSLIKDTLTAAGYEVVGEAANGETAIDLAYSLKPDLITLDNVLPDMMGIDILKTISESELDCNVLMVSAVGQEAMKDRAMQLGAMGYVVKPFKGEQLLEEVNRVFNKAEFLSKIA
ncbi:MAG: response regulator [Cyclobacteriaceae bacterium]